VFLINSFKSFWLTIYCQIKSLFGKRRMEIDKTIRKWLILLGAELERVGAISEKSDAQKCIYDYCLLIKIMVSEYSICILELSNENKELPARVLLRTLAELVIKFSWCMYEAHKDKSSFLTNCERWTKSSLMEKQKFNKRASECFNDKEIEQNLKECQDDINNTLINIRNMPDNAQLCKDLFGKKGGLYYLILFGSLHEVVHSNLTFLQRLGVTDKNNLVSYDNGNIVIKPMCMACVFLLLKHIYQFYQIDLTAIESEYSRLKDK